MTKMQILKEKLKLRKDYEKTGKFTKNFTFTCVVAYSNTLNGSV